MPATRTNRKPTMGAASLAGLAPVRKRSEGARLLAQSAPPNPYQRSYLKFWTELVYTVDEARAGEVRKAPDWPLFAELEHHLLTQPLLFLDKSRRVLASWFVCGFDVWLMAGGQDPRWPALMRSRRNRQIILAAAKMEDIQGSAWFMQSRVQFIVEELEDRGIREAWPTWPEWWWTKESGGNSLGAHINPVPQGKDKWRGAGVTLGHLEEVAAWSEAQESVESAKMTTQGGGHLVVLSTARVGTYAADLVLDQINTRGWR